MIIRKSPYPQPPLSLFLSLPGVPLFSANLIPTGTVTHWLINTGIMSAVPLDSKFMLNSGSKYLLYIGYIGVYKILKISINPIYMNQMPRAHPPHCQFSQPTNLQNLSKSSLKTSDSESNLHGMYTTSFLFVNTLS